MGIVAPGTLAAFFVLDLTLCLIPGPAVLGTISSALRGGSGRGLATACGVLLGNLGYFALSALGIAAVIAASSVAFGIIKFAGAAYLAYLGVRSLFARPHAIDPGAAVAGGERAAFSTGLLIQLANPKAIVFFASILPQFVDAHRSVPPQLIVFALVQTAIEFAVLSGYALAAERVRRSSGAGRIALWIERAGGAFLIAIALRIAREPLRAVP